ncbi:hypothetical protein V1511DRAFT_179123 [Dipodascopsis uninucleata]
MRSNDIALEYYDVSVYKSDFDNLRDDEWLNDNNLTFWYEFLERSQLNKSPENRIVLLRPSMVFLLAQSQNPLELKTVLPDLQGAAYIFCPINNNEDVNLAEGGSHWSLLVINVATCHGYYYDTLENINIREAEHVAKRLGPLLGGISIKLRPIATPQQTNGSDCGVLVCMITSCLVDRLLDSQNINSESVGSIPSHFLLEGKRHEHFSASRGRQLMSYTILDLIARYGRKIGDDIDVRIDSNAQSNDSDQTHEAQTSDSSSGLS